LKSAFLNVLSLKVFSFALKIILVVVFVWKFREFSLFNLIVGYIFLKLVLTVLKSSLLEPYQTCMMLVGFHKYRLNAEAKSNDGAPVELDQFEGQFNDMISKGKEDQMQFSKDFAQTLAGGLTLGGSKLLSRFDSILSTVKKKTPESQAPIEGNENS